MPTLNGSYTLKTLGAPTGVIDGKVYALLIQEEDAEKWVITPVSESGEDVLIRTSDLSKAWTVTSDEDFSQITVVSFEDSPAPNQIFHTVPVPGGDSEYLIQLYTNTSGKAIGRNFVEDKSLMPKAILTLGEGSTDIPQWLAGPV